MTRTCSRRSFFRRALEAGAGLSAWGLASGFGDATKPPFPGRFAPGSAEAELAVAPRPDAEIAVKHGYSAATEALLASLRTAGAREVALSGIATDNCVLMTAVGLFEAGVRPLVLADYCASHAGAEYHRAGLMLIERLVGEGQVVRGAE